MDRRAGECKFTAARLISRGRTRQQWYLPPLLMLCLCFPLIAGQDNKSVLMLVTPLPAENWYVRWVTEVYSQALAQLDYGLVVRRCEPRLCTELAARGEVDGELMRAGMYTSLVPDLLRLEESLVPITWSALTNDKNLKLDSWPQIRNSGLRIEFLADIPYLERQLTETAAGTQVTKVRHWTLGLNRLVAGKIDVYVGSDEIIGTYLDHPEYQGLYRAGIIETLKLYIYLNKKHKKLAADLSLVVAEMKAQGLIDEISRTVLTPMHRKSEYLQD